MGQHMGAKDPSEFYSWGMDALPPPTPCKILHHAQKHEDVFVVVFPIVLFDPLEELENVIPIHINLYF